MSVLATISKPAPRPPIITICGDAGTGKTSLAAEFPKPIFIRGEDGVGRISRKVNSPDAFPTLTNTAMLWDQLMALLNEEHDYSTLVVDSVTKLEELFMREILEKDTKAKGINQAYGGYGNGPAAVAAMHGRVRKAAGLLNEKRQMAVIFIAHAATEVVRPPDMEDHSRYSIKMMPKGISHYVDDVDLVGYVRLSMALRGDDDDRKLVVSTGDREFVCHPTAASITKNGLGITEPLPFAEGTNPLADALGITARIEATNPEPKENEE